MVRTIPGLNDPLPQHKLPASIGLAADVLSNYSTILAIAADYIDFGDSPSQTKAMTILLCRRVIQSLDAAAELVRVGRAEAAMAHYRTVLEVKWCIHHIVDDVHLSNSRASAFEFFQIQDDLKGLRRFRSHFTKHGQDWDYLSKDTLVDLNLLQGSADLASRVDDAVQSREDELAGERFAIVRQEIQSLIDSHSLKKIQSWHQCFGDRKGESVRDLARKVGETFYYEYFYRRWSNLIHPGSLHSSLAPGRDGTAYLHHICHLDGVEAAAAAVAVMAQGIIVTLIAKAVIKDAEGEIAYASAKAIRLRYALEDMPRARIVYNDELPTGIATE